MLNDALRNIPIFSDLNPKQLEDIASIIKYKNFKKGDVVFNEGDVGDYFCFVKEGKIKLYKTSPDGREMILTILNEGASFAEVTILNDIPYPATAEFLTDGELGMIYNMELEKMLLVNSELSLEIIRILSQRLYETNVKLSQFILNDAISRVSKILIDLSLENGKMTKDGVVLDLNITRQDLAGLAGTTRETATRILTKLKNQGIITESDKVIIIKDMKKLEKLSQSEV